MKSRSQWQNDADEAGAEASDAAIEYSRAMQEKQAAEAAVETAQASVMAAEASVASAESAVESARDSVSAARSALRSAQTPEERDAARSELTAAEADLDDCQNQLSHAREELQEAQRELSVAEHRLSSASDAVSQAQGNVDRSKSRLEDLLASAREARAYSSDVTIADGPARFARHFDSAREIWSGEVEFFDGLIEQLESSLGSLMSTVEDSNRPCRSLGFGSGFGGGLFGGGGLLPGFGGSFGMPSFYRGGLLPGMSPVSFGNLTSMVPVLASTSCAIGTVPLAMGTSHPYSGMGWGTSPSLVPQFASPSWAVRNGDNLFVGFNGPVPLGAVSPYCDLRTDPTTYTRYLPLQMTTSGHWAPASPFSPTLTSCLRATGGVGTGDLSGFGFSSVMGSTFQKSDSLGAGVLTIDPSWATHIHHSVDPLNSWWHVESQSKLASGRPAFEFSGYGSFSSAVDSLLPPSFGNSFAPVSSSGFGGGLASGGGSGGGFSGGASFYDVFSLSDVPYGGGYTGGYGGGMGGGFGCCS